MELGGKSLDDYLGESSGRSGPFRIQDLKRHVGDLAVAIATIHSLGCIHRDLKPPNILLVDKNGRLQLKLIDLGYMVKTEQGDNNPLICCAPGGKGTLIWMPLESIHGHEIGRASDWWAFGLIILQLLGYFGAGINAQECGVEGYRKGWEQRLLDSMLPRLRRNHSDIFSGSNQGGGLTEIASGCHFYNEYPEDREDLVKFAFYFLDPIRATRPFLRLEGDKFMPERFETREGEKARELQGLVNQLFPKFRVEAAPGAVSSGE
jgi:serine/threonine protein kinase